MTSENYRQLLNYDFEAKEMTKEEFDNTLMHFAMLYHKEQCVIHGVVFNEAFFKDLHTTPEEDAYWESYLDEKNKAK